MEDLSEHFKTWKKEQDQMAWKRKKFLKKRRYRQNKKPKDLKEKLEGSSTVKPSKVEALPNEFLEELVADKSPITNTKKTKSIKRSKKKIKLSSAIIDTADFIPLETNVSSTDFKVVRLDRDSKSTSLTSNVIEFYNKALHGKRIRREPVKNLFAGMEKLKAKRSLCVRR